MLVNSLNAWPKWSPYGKLGAAMQRSPGAITEGRGITYARLGNGKTGAGKMQITTSTP